MTKPFDNRIQQAAQGALQAIIQYGGAQIDTGTGYTHKIEILANGNVGIFVLSQWKIGGIPVYTESSFVDVLLNPNALQAGWDAAYKNILSIEHAQGRCVA